MEGTKYLEISLKTDELHRRIGKGIPAGSFMVIEGENASGKSILAQRLLYGFLKNGNSVTYISSELTTRDFLEQMSSLGYKVASYLTEKRLLFVPVFPRIGRVVPRRDFIYRLMRAEALFRNQAIIVDTLDSLIIDKLTKKDIFALISFIKKVINMNKTIIVTISPSGIDEETLKTLRSIADIYFAIKMREVGGSIKRVINVYRFRGASMTVADTIGFRVEPRVGFVIEISSVA
ncbi:ATPase domain-containing protein [Candidatus Pyrohabitans sp.]